MTGKDLVQALTEQFPGFNQRDIEQAAKIIQNSMLEAMGSGKRIEVRGFGSFSLVHHAQRVARNPSTGKPVQVSEKYVPHFKPGKKLRDDVNATLSSK